MNNFLSLSYFVATAQELSFTRAAQKLFISQQALSQTIAKLEDALGVQLFHRTNPLSLTFAGQRFYEQATQILSLRDSTVREMADIKDFKKGELRIGCSHTRGKVILPNILPDYMSAFPQVSVKIIEGNSAQLNEALERNDVDLTVGFGKYDPIFVETVHLCWEQIMLIVPDTILRRYFPSNYDEICKTLEDAVDLTLLKDCPFLMMNTQNQVRRIAEEIFRSSGIQPNIILETENIETLLALCAAGMGITFYPDMFLRNTISALSRSMPEDVHVYSLGYQNAAGTLYIAYRKDRYLTRAAREFISIAQKRLAPSSSGGFYLP